MRDSAAMSASPDVPVLVTQALNLCRSQGFVSSIRHEAGRLLAALAASRVGTLGELGTGCGVGAAWLCSALRAGARVVTAELDPVLAERARELFADDDRVEVRAGDWTTLEQFAPFSLLFIDVREVKRNGIDLIADLVEPGGIIVLDDFTPSSAWPPIYDGRVDDMRERWLTDPRFTAVDVTVAPDAAVVIATRR